MKDKKAIFNNKIKTGLSKNDESKFFAFISVLLLVVGFLITLVSKRDDKYAMFYAKQSLVLFFFSLPIMVLSRMPIIGWYILDPLLWTFWIILWIITMIYSLSGRQIDVPILGSFAKKINL